MILFFDTETTGKLDYKAPPQAPQQPHLVQLAAVLTCQKAERVFGAINLIVDPGGEFIISEEVAAIHGISQEIALSAGQPRRTVLSAFSHMCKHADKLVAHNLDFDRAVMETAYLREGVLHRMSELEKFCTMKALTPICKCPKLIKGRKVAGFKWPTLTEAHVHFFGDGFDGAHNAMVDVEAMIRCYRKLVEITG